MLALVDVGKEHQATQLFHGWPEHNSWRTKEAKLFLRKAFDLADRHAGKVAQILREHVSGTGKHGDLMQRFSHSCATMGVAIEKFFIPMYFQCADDPGETLQGPRMKIEAFLATEPVRRLQTLEAYRVWALDRHGVEKHFRAINEIDPSAPFLNEPRILG